MYTQRIRRTTSGPPCRDITHSESTGRSGWSRLPGILIGIITDRHLKNEMLWHGLDSSACHEPGKASSIEQG